MLVVVYTTLISGIWMLAHQQTTALLNLKEEHGERLDAWFGTDDGTDPAGDDPALRELAGALDLLGQLGPPAGLPADRPSACRGLIDTSIILEFEQSGERSWKIRAFAETDWVTHVAGDAKGPPGAIDRGLELLDKGLPPFDSPDLDPPHAYKVALDPGEGESLFAVEFVEIETASATSWTVAAYTQAEWTDPDNGRQPAWAALDDLP